MNKIFLALICFLVFSECSDLIDQRHIEITPTAKPAFDQFTKIARAYGFSFDGQSLIITTGNTGSHYAITDLNGSIPVITLSASYLSDLATYDDPNASYYLEFVLFHELAHALLRRGHVPAGSWSIMTPTMERAWDYCNADTRASLQRELFTPSTYGTLAGSSY